MSAKPYHYEEVDGTTLIVVDFRNLRGDALIEAFEACAAHTKTCPLNSLLALVLAHGLEYTRESMHAGIVMARSNGPHTKKSAMVGLGHLTNLVNIVNRLSGRSIRAFQDEDSARAWLLKDET